MTIKEACADLDNRLPANFKLMANAKRTFTAPLFRVNSGVVAVVRSRTSRTRDILVNGMYGGTLLFQDPEDEFCCLSDCTLYTWDNIDLHVRLNKYFQAALAKARRDLETSRTMNHRQNVATLLADLCEWFPQCDEGYYTMPDQITHERIASLLSVCREAVSAIVCDLRRRGAITSHGRGIRLDLTEMRNYTR